MGLRASSQDEVDALVNMASLGRAVGAKDFDHMNGAAAAFNYVRIADLVSRELEFRDIKKPILDWGCGYGQISWLLQRRGHAVVSFDVERRRARESIPQLNAIAVEYGTDPVILPYESSSFGAVLSVGVLEHVPDLRGSLKEVNRVLESQGFLFLFMFPNRYSWAEWVADRRGISVHSHKFTLRETSSLLGSHGFVVESKWRRNVLPRNLTGLPLSVKTVYGKFYREIEALDSILAGVPPISYLSGVLEVVARKCE